MAAAVRETGEQLEKLMECCICFKAYTDPRTLPCIHTFCLHCLEQIRQTLEKKQRKNMTCPICRKAFPVPVQGLSGLPKNFFMENLKDVKSALQSNVSNSPQVVCDICRAIYEEDTAMVREATAWCFHCRLNFCDFCSKAHKLQSKDHHIAKIGCETEEDIRRMLPKRNCSDHNQKPLDFYCADCRKLLCVSCFVEAHALHKCKDVTTIEDEIRQTIQTNVLKISSCAEKIVSQGDVLKRRKESVLSKLADIENEIIKRNSELKQTIDRHTVSLLEELSTIKGRQMKDFDIEKEEVECFYTILKSFEDYCYQLRSKGSASDVCGSYNDIIRRVDELEKDQKAFLSRPISAVDVSFEATDLEAMFLLPSSNILGRIQATKRTKEVGVYAVVVGTNVGDGTITQEVVRINLQHPYDVSNLPEVPAKMRREVTADVYDETIYVSGIGLNYDEIWKYNVTSGWMSCASLVQGRRRHCAAFIDEVLYICGGIVVSDKSVLDSVEAYNATRNECTTVGRLEKAVESSGNCLAIDNSLLYIFGGSGDHGKSSRHVQVYNTMQNTCSILSQTMPRSCVLVRAALWERWVVLLGRRTCLLFDLDTETWEEREQFNTGVDHFGLVVENGRLFVIGGGFDEKDADGKTTWKCRDYMKSVPVRNLIEDALEEWTINAELPVPCMVQTYAKMTFQSACEYIIQACIS